MHLRDLKKGHIVASKDWRVAQGEHAGHIASENIDSVFWDEALGKQTIESIEGTKFLVLSDPFKKTVFHGSLRENMTAVNIRMLDPNGVGEGDASFQIVQSDHYYEARVCNGLVQGGVDVEKDVKGRPITLDF